jgi:hypothetical protein
VSSKAVLIVALAILGMTASVWASLASYDARHKEAVDKLLEYKDVNPFRQMGKQTHEN